MSLITRCTACATLFKVVPDQLRISAGWVRCGQCGEIFDASAQMLTHPDSMALAPTGATASAAPAPSAAPPTAERDGAADPAPAPSFATPTAEAGVPPPSDAQAPAADDSEPPPAATEPDCGPAAADRTPPESPARNGSLPPAGAARISMAAGGAGLLRFPRREPASHEADADTDGDATLDHEPAPSASAPPARVAQPDPYEPAPQPLPHTPPAPDGNAAEPEAAAPPLAPDVDEPRPPARAIPSSPPSFDVAPSFVRQAERRAFWRSTPVRASIWLVLLLLALAVAAQLAYTHRDWLAGRAPRLAPALTAVCARLGCTIEPYRNLDAIAIESSTFNRTESGEFRLSLTLRNHGDMAVATPALELALTNAQDQVVLRRVLRPSDLGAAASLGARSEWSGAAALTVTSVPDQASIVGYRLLAFYP